MVAVVALNSNQIFIFVSKILLSYWCGYRKKYEKNTNSFKSWISMLVLSEGSFGWLIDVCFQAWRSFNSFRLLSSSISCNPKYLIIKKLSVIHGMAISILSVLLKALNQCCYRITCDPLQCNIKCDYIFSLELFGQEEKGSTSPRKCC